MKFTSRRDIEAPVAFVFASLRDFESWERAALRRGVDVARTDKLFDIGPGLSWMVKFVYRGRERRLALRLSGLVPPTTLEFSGSGTSLDGKAGLDLMELAARRTRLSVTLDLRPKTIGARVIMQSLRLTRARLDRRFADRVTQFCTEIEARYHQSTRG